MATQPRLPRHVMQSIAFPMRLQENGFLRREDTTVALVSLLQVMARTPRGSWPACPSFGLRDLFENSRQQADTGSQAMHRINEAFLDLGITSHIVSEVARELSPGREVDTYAITLQGQAASESFSTSLAYAL